MNGSPDRRESRHQEEGFLRGTVKLRFAPFVSVEEQAVIRQTLAQGPVASQRILHERSRVKTFYRVETPSRTLFVKARSFNGWPRRLGRTFRRTKEEREFKNGLILKERSIPSPEPIGTGRVYGRPLIKGSLLLQEHLPDAKPLRDLLPHGISARSSLLDGLGAFLALLREKGVIHRDLQWNNLMVRTRPSGPQFYLVDALHVRWTKGGAGEPFLRTLSWFLHFLLAEGAPPEVVEGFLDRLPHVGYDSPRTRAWLSAEAHRLGVERGTGRH